MLKNILIVLSVLAIARAQIPSLGWCPDYVPMANFDMGKFLGVWYEAERYFQLSEVVSRCVAANYTKGPDGKLRVSNEVTNRFTGIKRVLDGEIKLGPTKAEEGKLHVKYTTIPLTPETQYAILDTDYKNYAVLWSCSGIGPVHAQNAWLMTRSRRAPGEILQMAYGVLDKYKISKTFFVKTDQDDCAYLDESPEPSKPSENADKPTVEEATAEESVGVEQEGKSVINLRSAIVPDAPAIIVETRKAVIAAAAKKPAESAPAQSEILSDVMPEIQNAEPVQAPEEIEKELNSVEKTVEISPSSVPEVILNAADRAKEIVKKTIEEVKKFEPIETITETFEKPAEKFQEAFEKPAEKIQEAFEKPIKQIKEAFEKPLEKIKEALNIPSSENAEKLPEEVKEAEAPKEKIEENKEAANEKKIES